MSYDVKKNIHPPTFDNVIPLKLDKILPNETKAQGYITMTFLADLFSVKNSYGP